MLREQNEEADHKANSLKTILAKGRTFEQDRLIAAERSRRVAWSLVAVLASVSLMASGAVMVLANARTVEPYVIRVDNSTGIVDTVSALGDAANTYDEVVSRYFAAKYIRAREGFTMGEAKNNFDIVTLMSDTAEQERFAEFYDGRNPNSPQQIYGALGFVRIKEKSMSFLSDNVLSVRYLREERKGDEKKITHWIATITFEYTKTPASAGDRYINPLGFIVKNYRADPEAL